ncbi:hypothetical protein H0B56_18735 [Haloechinothrix sp. YIM 98757]|uniref:Carbon monoxide dehydrogenase subunit G n=1 Tax=Haloechinothrix aidingensis TaxID=2752311 RepID=A0A838AE58_9PSEU|nr:SRPBCC domain-containing protein [Haloechinothrix aidingensis]MBA0127586.1 hypothetical protein [Haloechinothrix aidingensis]
MITLTGRFDTPADAAALLALHGGPEALAAVPTLRGVRRDASGGIRAAFSPRGTFVPMPFALTVSVERASATGAQLAVRATRGQTAVDVQLRLGFEPSTSGTTVSWAADVSVRGTGATVGQRVVRDLVYAAIDEILRDTAAVA